MSELERLAQRLYKLMGLDKIDEHILSAIEDDLANSYFPLKMDDSDIGVRNYGSVLYGGLDLIKNGKQEFFPLIALDSENINWILKFSGGENMRISYMREDDPLQTWTIEVTFPEWPTKEDGTWLSGKLIIEKSLYQRAINGATLELNTELTEDQIKKIYTMYSFV